MACTNATPGAGETSRAAAQRRVSLLDYGSLNQRHLPSGAGDASLYVMVEPVSLTSYRDETLWAVVASIGRTSRVAEVFTSRLAAMADQAWREQQVYAYATFLRNSRQPTPSYTVKPIRRADLPRSWRPLPALGFLQGKLS